MERCFARIYTRVLMHETVYRTAALQDLYDSSGRQRNASCFALLTSQQIKCACRLLFFRRLRRRRQLWRRWRLWRPRRRSILCKILGERRLPVRFGFSRSLPPTRPLFRLLMQRHHVGHATTCTIWSSAVGARYQIGERPVHRAPVRPTRSRLRAPSWALTKTLAFTTSKTPHTFWHITPQLC